MDWNTILEIQTTEEAHDSIWPVFTVSFLGENMKFYQRHQAEKFCDGLQERGIVHEFEHKNIMGDKFTKIENLKTVKWTKEDFKIYYWWPSNGGN